MLRLALCTSTVLLVCASAGVQAQVYRCAGSTLYTDKPCAGANPVDVRPNVMNAGTRQIPADPDPAPAVIPPNRYDPPPVSGSAGNVFESRDARDAEYRSRTGPYTPQTYSPN